MIDKYFDVIRLCDLFEPESRIGGPLLEAFGMPFRQDNLPSQLSAAEWRQSRGGGDDEQDHEQQQGESTETTDEA